MRIAAAQIPGSCCEHWPATLKLLADVLRAAADQRADLVVLPECTWPAYALGTRNDYAAARAQGLPDPSRFLRHLQALAAELRVAVCAGYVAEDGPHLRNAASFIAADGRLLSTCYKSFLWDFDNRYFTRGTQLTPVDTPLGRIGTMICADARLPELPATLAARGATLILHPTAWVNAAAPAGPWNPQPDFLIAARAQEFGVPIVSASKWGRERDTDFVGQSLICDGRGQILAQCGGAETRVIVANVEPGPPRRAHLTPAERDVLLASAPPQLPPADVAPLRVVASPAPDRAPRRPGHEPASRAGLTLLVGPHRAVLYSASENPVVPSLEPGSTPRIIDCSGVRIGLVRDEDAGRFAAARALALQGAHAVVVFGDQVARCQVQTRACENRIFAIQISIRGWCIIHPSGQLCGTARWPCEAADSVSHVLDLSSTAQKAVVPGTNMFLDRHVAEYEF